MLNLRPAISEDFEFLRHLHRSGLKEYVEQIWGWDEAQQEQLLRDRFDPVKLQVIQIENTDVGVLQVEDRRTELFLANILVDPAHQNRGIGSQIISDLIARARDRGVPLHLSVLKPNRAKSLYERLGFRVSREDDVRYWMSLR